MAAYAVKNTFINTVSGSFVSEMDVDCARPTRGRRGASLPPQFKLFPAMPEAVRGIQSDDSTAASESGEECASPRGVWFSQSSSRDEREPYDTCFGCGGGWCPVSPLSSTAVGYELQMQQATCGPALISTSPSSLGMFGQALSQTSPGGQTSMGGQGQGTLSAALSSRSSISSSHGMLAPALTPSRTTPLLATCPATSGGRISLRNCLDPKARMFVPRSSPAVPTSSGTRSKEDSASERSSLREFGCGRSSSGSVGSPEAASLPCTGLSSKAYMFKPEGSPASAEVFDVICAAKEVLSKDARVQSVLVTKSPVGGTITMTAQVASGKLCDIDAVRRVAQTALLEASKMSQIVYFTGYAKQPFKDCGNSTSTRFSASLAVVEQSQQHIACWETYQQGCCSKPNSCRWKHPVASELMDLVVEIKKKPPQKSH